MINEKDAQLYYHDFLYALREMETDMENVYIMGNHELADYYFSLIKEKYPDAVMVKLEEKQYIAISDTAKVKLKKILEEIKANYQEMITYINHISEII